MKWTIKLGQLAGIDVYMHVTFLALLAIIALMTLPAGVTAAVSGVIFVILIFGCVLLHELGHALAARRYGVPTRDIILLPIGGVARMERMPDLPSQELVVALAGPAVNVVIAAVLFMVGIGLDTTLFQQLLWVNLMLVGFNLIPAFPMDGGRVLRALLAMRQPYHEATELAAQVGKSFAILFGIFGMVSGHVLLVLVAVFVFFGAGAEAKATRVKSRLGGAVAGDAALNDFRCLSEEHSLEDAIHTVLPGAQRDYPVLDRDGRLVGLLTRADLKAALDSRSRDTPISDLMRRDVPTAHPSEDLTIALDRLQSSGLETMPLVHEDRIFGLLTLDNIAEFIMFRKQTARA